MATPVETTQGDQENSAHAVTLTRPFYLADREITVEQFQRFMDDAQCPATEKPQAWQGANQQFSQTPDCPVQQVNWFDAVLYCNWLSKREGRKPCYERTGEKEKLKDYSNKEHEYDVWRCDFAADGYRLPTAAGWEYASRAGSAAAFCYGNDEDLLQQYAWFVVNAKSRSWPGGQKLPNAFGLFDMQGNVWEWCWDSFGSFSTDPVSDPTELSSHAVGSGRVLRGGEFMEGASNCRSAVYRHGLPMGRINHFGFRVCCGR